MPTSSQTAAQPHPPADIAPALGQFPPLAGADRLASIDALRGLAALAVCWYHMTNGFPGGSFLQQSGAYGWLGVEVFFVISGFILPHVMWRQGYRPGRDWAAFMAKRIVRIEPPYLLALFMGIALWQLSSMLPGFRGTDPPDFISTRVLLHVGYLTEITGHRWLSPVFWTLAIEFQFYLLLSLCFPWLQSRHPARQLALMIVMAGAFLVIEAHSLAFRYLGLFLFGVVAFQWRERIVHPAVAVIGLVLATASVHAAHDLATAATGLATALLLIGNVPLGKWRPLTMLGTISFSLYLVHVPIGGRVINWGTRYVTQPGSQLALTVLAVLVSIAAATVFYLLVERPSQQRAARIKYRH